MSKMEEWVDTGVIPVPTTPPRIIELGDQMLNAGTPPEAVSKLIKKFNSNFDSATIAGGLPNRSGVVFAYELWHRCGFDYLSYDVNPAPYSKVFDLNFDVVPDADRQTGTIVTNIGTTEHVANQLNAFRTVHDLLKVGGVAIHQVPFAGMLNHSLVNYHPKFFFSLIVNNRYRLCDVQMDGPSRHSDLGVGNTVYDGDCVKACVEIRGSEAWANSPMYSGTITLVIERVFPDDFVPPTDFAHGYFGDAQGGDLSVLIGTPKLPHSSWAEAYQRSRMSSQEKELSPSAKQSFLARMRSRW
jgi:hypothetical protein